MSEPRHQVAAAPHWLSSVPGAVWPAIGTAISAQLQSLLFQFEQSQWLPPDMLREHQLQQLKLVLQHARETVPFYSTVLQGLDVGRLDWPRFATLPTLHRKMLQAGFDALGSRRIPSGHGGVTTSESSGSTGTPIRYRATEASQLFWEALTLREHLWHERDFSGRLAAIRVRVEEARLPDWGAPVSRVFRTGPGATLNVRTDVARQLEWLLQENPDYLITHASNLGALAELSIKRGIRLPRLRQARTFSEALRPDLRERVRAAWGVGIADVYSCSEAGVIALQCPLHEHYHVQAENLVVEVLHPDGSTCGPGESGELVLTTLHNFAMPLIRYRLGDHAEVGEPCPCGRSLPVLKRIHGRQRNMAVLPDGSRSWPSFPASLWSAAAPVEQFQLVQRSPDEIEANYVMHRALDEAESEQIIASLQKHLGFPFRIRLRQVPAIDRGASNKFEDFISALPDAGNP